LYIRKVKAEAAYDRGKDKEAIELFTGIINEDNDPEDLGKAHNLRGMSYHLTGNKDKAIADFKKAIDYGYHKAIENLKEHYNITYTPQKPSPSGGSPQVQIGRDGTIIRGSSVPPKPTIPFPSSSTPSNPFPPQPMTNSLPIAPAGRSAGNKQVSVLIVEDSALIRNLLGNIIEENPDLVIAEKAMNGVFALNKIPRCNPDVILLDFDMPEMDGIEFLKECAKRGIKIPVVMLATDKDSKEQIGAALSLGASEYIMKPNSMSTANDKKIIADKLRKYSN